MSFLKKSQLYPVLEKKHSHIRDKNIKFFEEDHKYIIKCDPDVKYTSVTTWCHSHFPHFDADEVINNMMKGKSWKEGHKYWGKTADEIKNLMLVHWYGHRIRILNSFADSVYKKFPTPLFFHFIE